MSKLQTLLRKRPVLALVISDILFFATFVLVCAGVKGYVESFLATALAASAALIGMVWVGWQGAVGLMQRKAKGK